jgi:hypothetical protein
MVSIRPFFGHSRVPPRLAGVAEHDVTVGTVQVPFVRAPFALTD